jgi:hypothetical protein
MNKYMQEVKNNDITDISEIINISVYNICRIL